jgi:tetratricopeptide (TPR) repeat protein
MRNVKVRRGAAHRQSRPGVEGLESRQLLCLAHLALKRPDAAIDDLRAASEGLNDRADVFYHLAEALAAARKTPEALAAAESALKLNPAYADARALSDRLKR